MAAFDQNNCFKIKLVFFSQKKKKVAREEMQEKIYPSIYLSIFKLNGQRYDQSMAVYETESSHRQRPG